METFTAADRDSVEFFGQHGWVLIDCLDRETKRRLPIWSDQVAALGDGEGDWFHHHEQTETGPALCRTENFVPHHAELLQLLGVELAAVAGALLGEPAVLYKEKINYKLPGGAGFSPHQDARAYPLIERHISAMVAVDEATPLNGGLQVADGSQHVLLATDDRGVVLDELSEQLEWTDVAVPQGVTLWFDSWLPHRSGPNRSDAPRRALFPTYNAASQGDLRSAYYEAKRALFDRTTDGDRVTLSFTGDFEGRPVT